MKDILFYLGIILFVSQTIVTSIFDNFLSNLLVSNLLLLIPFILVIASYRIKGEYLKLPFLSENNKTIEKVGYFIIVGAVIMMSSVFFEFILISKTIINITLVLGLMLTFFAKREQVKLKIQNNEYKNL